MIDCRKNLDEDSNNRGYTKTVYFKNKFQKNNFGTTSTEGFKNSNY